MIHALRPQAQADPPSSSTEQAPALSPTTSQARPPGVEGDRRDRGPPECEHECKWDAHEGEDGDHEPPLGHEYQFDLSLADARLTAHGSFGRVGVVLDVHRSRAEMNYAAADGVIGKPDFFTRDYENQDPIWPYSVKISPEGVMAVTNAMADKLGLDPSTAKGREALEDGQVGDLL